MLTAEHFTLDQLRQYPKGPGHGARGASNACVEATTQQLKGNTP